MGISTWYFESAAQRLRSAARCAGTTGIDWYWCQNAYDLVEQAKRSESAGTHC